MLKGVTDIQTALINMLEIALLAKMQRQRRTFFADMYKTITRQILFPRVDALQCPFAACHR